MENREKFLAQSYRDALANYEYTCSNTKAARWDIVVITASSSRQAESYRMQIEKRNRDGSFPLHTKFIVIPDLNDERIGSGGATLNVLYQLAESLGIENLLKKKILLMHSGGDSKRIPQYSACGKLFSPVPRLLPDGRISTIFDELLISVSGIPDRIGSGVMVLPSDTVLLFNPLQLDLLSCDAAGLSMKVDIEEGTEHGVFLQGKDSFDHRNKNVALFLHKQSEEKLRFFGAPDICNQVDVDTGCVWLGKKVTGALLQLVMENGRLSHERMRRFVNSKVCLSFYGDFLYPLAEDSTLEEYYKEMPENMFSVDLKECRTEIWERLHGFKLSLVKMVPARYIHFGMTHEIYDMIVWDIGKYGYLEWNKRLLTNAKSGSVLNSYIDSTANIPDETFIEDCVIEKNVSVGRGAVLSGIRISDISIPDNVVLHALKLLDGKYVCRIYGREDNPKSSKTSSFLGGTLNSMMKMYGIGDNELWEEATASIWNAKLYKACDTLQEAVLSAVKLYAIMQGRVPLNQIEDWRNSKRYSLRDSFHNADVSEIMKWKGEVSSTVRIKKCIELLEGGKEQILARQMLGNVMTEGTKAELCSYAEQGGFPVNMRIYLLIADMERAAGRNAESWEDKAYRTVRNKIIEAVTSKHKFNYETAGFINEKMTIQLPVRVNFCGSPSDAAPYCLEHGGTMLDGTLLLKGKKPIEIAVERLERNVIILESRDMECCRTFESVTELRNCGNPHDAFALHKAVLIACGVVPLDTEEITLKDICERIGGGIKLSTTVDIPKGSGLGTSSILAAGCIKAVNGILNQDTCDKCVYAQVFLAEQLMETGGGWQDQVGGLTNGIKYFTSKPGDYQDIYVEYPVLDDGVKKELNSRFALIFSGQRRLARNVLREEMNQCIRNDKKAMNVIEHMREYCALMKYSLEKGDVTTFASYITKQFELVKQLDQGSSNACIEYIFDVCDDLIDGKSICGAGGGGFLQVILKKGVSKEMLKKRISNEFSDCGVEVWDCELI